MAVGVRRSTVLSAQAVASNDNPDQLDWELTIKRPDGSMTKRNQTLLIQQAGKPPTCVVKFWRVVGQGTFEEGDTVNAPVSVDGDGYEDDDDDDDDDNDNDISDHRRRRLNHELEGSSPKRIRLSDEDDDDETIRSPSSPTRQALFRSPSPETLDEDDEESSGIIKKIDFRTKEGRAIATRRREIIVAELLQQSLQAPPPSTIQVVPSTRSTIAPLSTKARIAAGIAAGSYRLSDRPLVPVPSIIPPAARRQTVITYDSTSKGMVSLSRIYAPSPHTPSTAVAGETPQSNRLTPGTNVDTPASAAAWASELGDDMMALSPVRKGDKGDIVNIEDEDLPDFEDLDDEPPVTQQPSGIPPRPPVAEDSQFGVPNVDLNPQPRRWKPPPPPAGWKELDMRKDPAPVRQPRPEPLRQAPQIIDAHTEREELVVSLHMSADICTALGLPPAPIKVKFKQFSETGLDRALNDPLRGLRNISLAIIRPVPNDDRLREQIVRKSGMCARLYVVNDNFEGSGYGALTKVAAFLEETNSYVETRSAIPHAKLVFFPSMNQNCYGLFLVPKGLQGFHQTLLVCRLNL